MAIPPPGRPASALPPPPPLLSPPPPPVINAALSVPSADAGPVNRPVRPRSGGRDRTGKIDCAAGNADLVASSSGTSSRPAVKLQENRRARRRWTRPGARLPGSVITCGGRFDRPPPYRDNVVVTAVPALTRPPPAPARGGDYPETPAHRRDGGESVSPISLSTEPGTTYLDHAATTPMLPEAVEVMAEALPHRQRLVAALRGPPVAARSSRSPASGSPRRSARGRRRWCSPPAAPRATTSP